MPLYGIDISSYQDGIDLSVVPCDFVGVYVSGGTDSTNPAAARQVSDAVANGKRLLLYHFENDGNAPGTAAAEAAWFAQQVRALGSLPANTLYALDNETGNALNIQWQADFLNATRSSFGAGVGMYGPYSNISGGAYQPLRDAGFFIWESAYVLGYQRIDGYNPPDGRAPIPGGDPAIWQFTSSGYLPGWAGALDLNVFLAGGPAEWDALAGAVNGQSGTVTPLRSPDEQFFLDLGIGLP